MNDKINLTCGSRPCNQPTTLNDIKQTVMVLESTCGYFNTYRMVGHAYSQALASLESVMRLVDPVERNDYITPTSTQDFNVDTWKSIFKYNLWDAMVSYAHEQVNHEFDNGSIVTKLVSTRLELDRRLSEDDGKRYLKHSIQWGYGLSWSELFNAFAAKIKFNLQWNVIHKIKVNLKRFKLA